MDDPVFQGVKATLVSQAGEEDQDYQDHPESKVSLVQGVILDMKEIRYTINLLFLHII